LQRECAMKKKLNMFLLFVLIGSIAFASIGCKKKVVEKPTEKPTEIEKPVIQVAEEPDSIKTFQQNAQKAFQEQIQAYFSEAPDKDKKIEIFEKAMTDLAQEYYRYYVEQMKLDIEKAKEQMTAFLNKIDADGVGLTKDSIPFYLERIKKK